LIVFDASALVGAALKVDSVPERALLRAEEVDLFALSAAVDTSAIPLERRNGIMAILRGTAVWFEPSVPVTDCRDPKDNNYLELALAAGAEMRGVRILRPADYIAQI
jgi:hypothetical protein